MAQVEHLTEELSDCHFQLANLESDKIEGQSEARRDATQANLEAAENTQVLTVLKCCLTVSLSLWVSLFDVSASLFVCFVPASVECNSCYNHHGWDGEYSSSTMPLYALTITHSHSHSALCLLLR